MDQNLEFVKDLQLERVKAALEKNNMEAHIVASAQEVVPLMRQLLKKGDIVANGGSMTLKEAGVMELLRSGEYQFLDRETPGIDKKELYRQAFSADVYIASANAVTESGEIYQIDGQANRVAAIAYGPDSVILVVGRNKIVADLEAARLRRIEIASPANARRVGAKTPCATTGRCSDCTSPGRICCTELILRQQLTHRRVKVILVNQELGY